MMTKLVFALPLSDLSVVQVEYLRHLMQIELPEPEFWFIPPALQISSGGRICISEINAGGRIGLTHGEFCCMVARVIEKILADFDIRIPGIEFETVTFSMPTEEELSQYIAINPEKFGNPRWYHFFLRRERTRLYSQARDEIYAEECRQADRNGRASLAELERQLLPFSRQLHFAIEAQARLYSQKKHRRERIFQDVTEVKIPFSFQGGGVRRFNFSPPLELRLNGQLVTVWFSERDKDGVPSEVSFKWIPEEGQAIVFSFERGRFYYVADYFFSGLELIFDEVMVIRAVGEGADIGITLQMQDYLKMQGATLT